MSIGLFNAMNKQLLFYSWHEEYSVLKPNHIFFFYYPPEVYLRANRRSQTKKVDIQFVYLEFETRQVACYLLKELNEQA
jgi:hypothetical protein